MQGGGNSMFKSRIFTAARFALGLYCVAAIIQPNIVVAEGSLSQPEYGVIFQEDVAITMRDGTVLKADVYRPDDGDAGADFPVLVSLSAYQKSMDRILPHIRPFTHVERPEPDWWVARGYVLVFVDTRGTGKSSGKAAIWSMQEARDLYDVIEWSAKQDWGNGKVGLTGVSYYAITQWNVASLRPPSLTAIVPWEGWADLYRDSVFHGGLLNQNFYGRWWTDVVGKQLLEATRADNSAAFDENLMWNFMTHHTDGPWWDEVKSRAQFDQIEVPLYSSGNWGGWNHHLRGNVEAYVQSASKHKKLQVHIGGHTDAFYSDEGKNEMLRWYDYWLKGKDTGIMDEPPVKLCIRVSVDECNWRFENEWPLARTEYTKFYLSAQSANAVDDAMHDLELSSTAPKKAASITFPSGPEAYRRGKSGQPMVTFVTGPLKEEVEVTGHIKLMLWVSSETDDMDVFAYLRNMAPDGSVETATRGILKVSHRKLDPELSEPYRPYHAHDEEQKLKPGEIVPIEVEIWATSMVFKKGHRIRLDVQPHDGEHYFAAYKLKDNTIYIGGDRASYVLLPIIPTQDQH